MIIYDLECAMGHRFEGWFPDIKNFERQKESGLIQCAVCGIDQIRRLPSGGHLKGLKPEQVKKAQFSSPAKKSDNSGSMNVNVDPVTLLKAVDHYVKTHFKNVGERFAKKALEIHRGVSPQESIYGTATKEENERLAEEGVPFCTLPKIPESVEN